MMNLRAVIGLWAFALIAAACEGSNNNEIVPVRQGADASGLPITNPVAASPIPVTGTTGQGDANLTLIGPAVPAGVTTIPLRARLTATNGTTLVVTSVHPTASGVVATALPSGTYTLNYLDENDTPTAFSATVQLRTGQTTRLAIGSVWIDPASAVEPSRTDVVSLTYRIASTEGTLKTVTANLNTVVDLPSRPFFWHAQGNTGELPPMLIDADEGLLLQTLGSIFVQKDITDSISINAANGVVVFPETTDGTEYLLPATTQQQGCMVYLGIINLLTVRTVSLCSDAQFHVTLSP